MSEDRISSAAGRYIASLSSQEKRRDATDYAMMDRQEFQARFGPGVDELDEKVTRILVLLEGQPAVGGGPLTRAAVWAERTPTRRAASAVALITALAALASAAAELLRATLGGG